MFRFATMTVLIFLQTFPAFSGDGLWDDETPSNLQALPVVLRNESEISDDYIKLGDLFSGLESKLDDRAVAPAPALGKDVILNAEWLEKLAVKNGISWKPSSAAQVITVKRAAKEIGKSEIIAAVQKALAQNGLPENTEIDIKKGADVLLVPAKASYRLEPKSTSFDANAQTFAVDMVLYVNGKKTETLPFSGRTQTFVNLPTAAFLLAKGQILTTDDIIMKKVPQKDAPKGTVTRLEDLIGKEVKRSTRAGQLLTVDDVRSKVMVSKGKLTTLNYVKGGIMLSAQGKSLENGGLGDTVKVLNTQSKSVVQGTVTGPETVTVTGN